MKASCSRRSFLKGVMAVGAVSLLGRNIHQVPVGEVSRARLIPVMLTPYRQDLSIDTGGLEKLIEFYRKSGAGGFFANCLSSEMYQLSGEEQRKITAITVKHAGRTFPVVATGSFGDTMADKVACVKQMGDIGVDAVVLITSHFAQKGQDARVMMDNLLNLADQTQGVSLGTYECPTPYKRLLSADEYQELSDTGRFTYHKDTSGDIEQLREKIAISQGGAYRVFSAHAQTAVPFIQAGGSGLSPIAGNCFPEIFAWICKHGQQPEMSDQLTYIQQELIAAEEIVSLKYPLSAKYFLQKRGVPIEVNSRMQKRQLTTADTDALDKLYTKIETWRANLGI